VAVLLAGAAASGFFLYADRREAAEGLAERWLREQGLDGELRVERLDADGFSGSLRIGSVRDPDLAVERVEVDLTLEPAWANDPFALRTRAIRLVRPRLKARLDDRGLTFGRLDPTVRTLLDRPDSGEPGPLVLVEDGSVRLFTPYGPVRLRGGGAAEDGRLVRLDGRMRPVRLEGPRLAADVGEGFIRLTGRGDRMTLRATAPVRELSSDAVELRAGDVVLDIDLPYPEGRPLSIRGPVTAELVLSGERLGLGGLVSSEARVRLGIEGRASGPIGGASFRGMLDLVATAADARREGFRAVGAAVRAEDLRLRVDRPESGPALSLSGATNVSLGRVDVAGGRIERARGVLFASDARLARRNNGPVLSGPARMSFTADRYVASDLTVDQVTGEAATSLGLFTGSGEDLVLQARAARASSELDGRALSLDGASLRLAGPAVLRDGFTWNATGAAAAAGSFNESEAAAVADRIPLLGADDGHRGAIVAGLADFDVEAPAVALQVEPGEVEVALPSAAVLRGRSGAELTVAGAPVWRSADRVLSGEARLTARGGGLPNGELTLAGWTLRNGVFASDVRVSARGLDAAVARDATLAATGRATWSAGRFAFVAAECAPVQISEVEFGENDLREAAGEVCPLSSAPLVTADEDGWRARGTFQRASLTWPVAEARASAARGAFDVVGGAAGLSTADVRLGAARVADLAPASRYVPVRVAGGVALRSGVWRGRFDLASNDNVRLGVVNVLHQDGSGVGGAEIDAQGLTFASDGLQPEDLSPLAAGFVADARGVLDFTGRVDWTPAGTTSSGRVSTAGIDFESPAGGVSQITGEVFLTSLTPLISAPEQQISIRRVDALTEITDASTLVTLGPDAVVFDSTRFSVAGGVLRIDEFSVPLDGGERYSGVVVVDGVQLGQVLEALNLGEAIDLDAVVDGRLPFAVAPGQVRFDQGRLAARQPGRIEISRTALTGVEAASPVAEQPVNAVQEFAYQAMENLSFRKLEVEVNSLPEGRLGLLFRIEGQHDPEIVEEARVGWLEALRGEAFQRRIPLPAGTPVNLTLDTTLNFDELLQAWLDVARRRQAEAARSVPVQSPAPRETP
jgi:hypothetical protein